MDPRRRSREVARTAAMHVVIALAIAITLGCGDASPAPTPASAPVNDVSAPAEVSTELLQEADARARAGDLEGALAKAEAALAAGGGRDAALVVAKLAIDGKQLDRAAAVLGPLVEADPADAIAQYDLALVHDHRDDYNAARRGYLAALRADPGHADARHNLAVLCWRQGVHEEARHHVQKFRTQHPEDPRGAVLTAMTLPPGASARPVPQ